MKTKETGAGGGVGRPSWVSGSDRASMIGDGRVSNMKWEWRSLSGEEGE